MNFARRVTVAATILTLLTAGVAQAHPLGNFTINHSTAIAAARQRITIRYALDMAEIPSFAVIRSIAPDAHLSQGELAAWGAAESRELLPQLRVTSGLQRFQLFLDREHAQTRAGAGGLSTLYLVIDAHAIVPEGAARYFFEDTTFSGRIGWHDAIVAPEADVTNGLRQYPAERLQSPPDVRSVSFERTARGTLARLPDASGPRAIAPASGIPVLRSNQLSDLLAKGTADPRLIMLTLLAAIALGALHALEPGHGKTLLAVTLVGARATVGQAAILAGALTSAHTAAVLALGIAINSFKRLLVPEDVYPWITLLSGAAIAFIGARAVARHLSSSGLLAHPHDRAHHHAHEHDGAHPHEHDHVHVTMGGAAHGHDHAHLDEEAHARLHAIPGTERMRFGPAVWAAMSGGIAPCPAALVVLLAAFALNETLYGVVVIVAFSLGLAAMLTGIGIAVVRGASVLARLSAFDRLAAFGPLASASIMACIGCVLLGQGFQERGVDVSPLVVSLLAALSIAGYAASSAVGHAHAEPV